MCKNEQSYEVIDSKRNSKQKLKQQILMNHQIGSFIKNKGNKRTSKKINEVDG